MMYYQNKQGLSLIELIVIMTLLLVLAASVFLWIDPLARIGESKNKKRTEDVNVLAAAIVDYANNNNGVLPVLGAITTTKKVLCSSQAGSDLTCDGASELCLTIDDDDFYKYLAVLPYDPDKTSTADSGYFLQKDSNDNLIVGACDTYNLVDVDKVVALKVACVAYGGGNCLYEGASTNIDCDEVCNTANSNLDCVTNATYGPDTDINGAVFCKLTKDLGKTCTTCSAVATGTPPSFDGSTTCAVPTGVITCSTLAGASNYPICACK